MKKLDYYFFVFAIACLFVSLICAWQVIDDTDMRLRVIEKENVGLRTYDSCIEATHDWEGCKLTP